MSGARLEDRAAELRRAFDRAFAEAPVERRVGVDAFLGARVGGAEYALRLAELAGIVFDRRIVPVPSSAPALLGLAGIRGVVTPVYGLHRLLGHAPPQESPRWIVLAREELVGFAFDQLDDHLIVPSSAIMPIHGEAAPGHVREIIRVSGTTRPVVSIHSTVAAVLPHAGPRETIKER